MKKSLKLFLSLAAMSLVGVTYVNAQAEATPPAGQRGQGGQRGGGRAQMTPEQQIQRLEQAVGTLTDGQKAKITAIYKKTAEKMQEMRNGGGAREEMMPKMQEIMKANREQVRAVLTAEQQKKFDDMPQQGPGGRQGGRGGQGGGGNPPPTKN